MVDKNSDYYKRYKAYILSPAFKARKVALIEKRGLRCEHCPRLIEQPADLHTHHITYERLYNEDDSDLLLLCPSCHKKAHGISKNIFAPKGMEVWQPQATFVKAYDVSWQFVSQQLNANVFMAAHHLSIIAKRGTNSLSPLKEDSSIAELKEAFGVSKNKAKPLLKELINLGVCLPGRKGYLVFNPFLSFSGKTPKSELTELFKDTPIAKAFYEPE